MSQVNLSQPVSLSALPPDMHIKLLKKVAQLTKVIYTLNTKCEDNENVIAAFKQKQEEELSRQTVEFATRCEHLREEIKRELLTCKTEMDEANEKSGSLERLLKDVEKQAEQHNNYYVSQIQEVESKYKQQINVLQETINEAKNRITESTKNKNKSDEKITQLQLKHQQEIEQVTVKFRDESHLLKTKLSDIQSEYDKISAENNSNLMAHKIEVNKLNEAHINAMSQAFLEAEKKSEEKINKLMIESQHENASFKEQIDTVIAQVSTLKHDKKIISTLVEDLKATLATVTDNCCKYKSQVDSLNQTKNDSELKFKEKITSLANENNTLTLSLEKYKGVESRLQQFQAEKSSFEETVKMMQNEKDVLFRSLSQIREEKEKGDTKYQQSDLITQKKLKTMQNECLCLQKQLSQINKDLEKERAESQVRSEQQILNLEKEHKLFVNELELKHKETMENAKKNTQAALLNLHQELSTSHKFEIDKAKNERDNQIKMLENRSTQLENALLERQHQFNELEENLKLKTSRIASAKKESEASKDRIRVLEVELKSGNVEGNNLKGKINSLEEKYASLQIELERREKDLISAHDSEKRKHISELNIEWKGKLTSQINEIELRYKEQFAKEFELIEKENNDKLSSELARLESNWQEVDTQNKQKIDLLNNDLKTLHHLKRQIEAVLKEKEEQLELERREKSDMTHITAAELENITKRHQQEISNVKQTMEMKFSTQLVDMEEKHRKQHEDSIISHNISIKVLEENLRDRNLQALRDIEKRNEIKVDNIKFQYNKELEKLTQNTKDLHNKAISVQEDEFSRQISEKNNKVSELQADITRFDKQIADHNKANGDYKEDIVRLKNDITEMGVALEKKESKILELRRESSYQLKNNEQILKQAHQNDLREIEKSYQMKNKQLAGDFVVIRQKLEAKVSQLNGELDNAEKRYQTREPRSEDMMLISKLQAQVKEKEMQIEKIEEEMKLFKLELMNREQNYNKLFNSKPTVGTFINHKTNRTNSTDGARFSYQSAPSLSEHSTHNLSGTTSKKKTTDKTTSK